MAAHFLLGSMKKPSHLSLIPPRLALRLLSLASPRRPNTSGRTQKKRAATPAAAEQVYHCLGAMSWLVGPSHLECADETIRCNRRVAACCRERERDNLLSQTQSKEW